VHQPDIAAKTETRERATRGRNAHEYSPEYNRNTSLTTAATLSAADPPQQKPSFQIQVSKKQ